MKAGPERLYDMLNIDLTASNDLNPGGRSGFEWNEIREVSARMDCAVNQWCLIAGITLAITFN